MSTPAEPHTEHNAADWIRRHAEADGGRLAVADDERRFGYRELESRVARLAGWLRAQGIERGDRVAVLVGNRCENLETAFAAVHLGAIVLPINTRLSPPEVCFLLDDSRARGLVHEPHFRELADAACKLAATAPEVRLEVGPAYEAALETAPAPVAAVTPEDPMILMYTSGTTGHPKGALLPHRKALYNSKNAEIYFGITREDRVLVVSPLFHSLGLQILSLPVLYCGGSLVLQAHFQPEALLAAVTRNRITYMGAVPTVYQRLLDEIEADETPHHELDSLRFLFVAGAAASAELVRAYKRRGLLLVQGYGQTESSTLTCLSGEDAERKAGSVGLPVHHAELRIISLDTIDGPVDAWRDVDPHEQKEEGSEEEGRERSEGSEKGEIVVRGPIVMLGYWERPEANAETLREGWLRTGDLARRDDEGFITLAGRSREMFISGGENVYPAEVEASYMEHPAIREIAVVGVPDPRWGETGHAHVVLEAGERIDASELETWGRERLARFKIPSAFVFEGELPKTASGKVQKHRLS